MAHFLTIADAATAISAAANAKPIVNATTNEL
jgi:hypothetical protein